MAIFNFMWSKLFKAYLKINGWKYIGGFDKNLKKCVLIAAPHTSNYDFPLAQAAFYLMGIKTNYLAKKELFKGPMEKLFKKWGGIPVDRSKKTDLVDQMAKLFSEYQELILVLSPEGTRKRVDTWKSGFYHIAKAANVPVACGYLDYAKKEAGIGKIIYDLSDIDKVIDEIRKFYLTITPKYPENYNPNFTLVKRK